VPDVFLITPIFAVITPLLPPLLIATRCGLPPRYATGSLLQCTIVLLYPVDGIDSLHGFHSWCVMTYFVHTGSQWSSQVTLAVIMSMCYLTTVTQNSRLWYLSKSKNDVTTTRLANLRPARLCWAFWLSSILLNSTNICTVETNIYNYRYINTAIVYFPMYSRVWWNLLYQLQLILAIFQHKIKPL